MRHYISKKHIRKLPAASRSGVAVQPGRTRPSHTHKPAHSVPTPSVLRGPLPHDIDCPRAGNATAWVPYLWDPYGNLENVVRVPHMRIWQWLPIQGWPTKIISPQIPSQAGPRWYVDPISLHIYQQVPIGLCSLELPVDSLYGPVHNTCEVRDKAVDAIHTARWSAIPIDISRPHEEPEVQTIEFAISHGRLGDVRIKFVGDSRIWVAELHGGCRQRRDAVDCCNLSHAVYNTHRDGGRQP